MSITTTTSTASGQTPMPVSSQIADRALRRVEQALDGTQELTNSTFDSLKGGVGQAREKVPAAIARATAQVQDATHRGLERARELGGDVRDKAYRTSDRTVGYIQQKPVKAVLIAAAAGAVLALMLRARSNSKRSD